MTLAVALLAVLLGTITATYSRRTIHRWEYRSCLRNIARMEVELGMREPTVDERAPAKSSARVRYTETVHRGSWEQDREARNRETIADNLAWVEQVFGKEAAKEARRTYL